MSTRESIAMRTHTTIDSPIGRLTLVATDGVLCGVYLDGQLHLPDPAAFGPRVSHGFEEAEEQFAGYFAGQREDFTLPVRPAGSEFQRRVWQTLTTIPYGQTWTYAQLAGAIGRLDRIRAVAAANARNPVAIAIPCHRVIGSDGSLTGYAGGLARKRFLLELESPVGAAAGRLF
jgi:methylated-DNA-[protein]-cysteine S-methyltransferase